MEFKDRALELSEYIIEQRRHLHANPELSEKEFKTTEHIAKELESMGIEPIYWDGITGLTAEIEGGMPGPVIMLRADIDALPINEPQNKPYSSKNPGVMHACGHDAHTAMLLGAAKMLNERKNELKGTVRLLFQMGEETGVLSGEYIVRGALKGAAGIFGMHVWPTLDAGKANFDYGERMASNDRFTIKVKGRAAHATTPQKGNDAVVAAAAVVTALQTIVARINDPLNTLVVSACMMNGGDRRDVIADSVEIVGSYRTFNRELRSELPKMMREIATQAASVYGCEVECKHELLPSPVINEHEDLVEASRGAVEKVLGPDALVPMKRLMGSEDFSLFMDEIPGVYGFLGSRNAEKGIVGTNHHPEFDIDEEVLHSGAAIYAQFAMDWLENKSKENG